MVGVLSKEKRMSHFSCFILFDSDAVTYYPYYCGAIPHLFGVYLFGNMIKAQQFKGHFSKN